MTTIVQATTTVGIEIADEIRPQYWEILTPETYEYLN